MPSFVRGWLTGSHPPGLILGPNAFGELLVTDTGVVRDKTPVRTATKEDILAAREREPMTVTEFQMVQLRVQSEVFGL